MPHPADVLELLGAHVVSVHDEALAVRLQQVAELGVILRRTKTTLSGSLTPVSLTKTSFYPKKQKQSTLDSHSGKSAPPPSC